MSYIDGRVQNENDLSSTDNDLTFSTILAFSYYDGPESGLALSSDGLGFRFLALGDSASGMFRAFEFHSINGKWDQPIYNLKEDLNIAEHGRVIFCNDENTALSELEKHVLKAEAIASYVCVASRQLEWCNICRVSEVELNGFHELFGPFNKFKAVHHLLKSRTQKEDKPA